MKKITIFLLFLIPTALFAQISTGEPYFYLGLRAGAANTQDLANCDSCSNWDFNFPYGDLHSHSVGFYGGYRFHRYMSAEILYFDSNVSTARMVTFDSDRKPISYRHVDTEQKSLGGALKGILPVTSWLAFQAKLGWHFYKADYETRLYDNSYRLLDASQEEYDDSNVFFGAGFDFRINRRLNLGLEAEQFNGTAEDHPGPDVRESTSFTTKNYTITLAYKF